mmetsp:Transcript_53366/g.167892  ORF Transcript_53366/g.167892 Transcript_53366/m.167892 type:complete len:415 (-) Transcript_53366:724-1968(-)
MLGLEALQVAKAMRGGGTKQRVMRHGQLRVRAQALDQGLRIANEARGELGRLRQALPHVVASKCHERRLLELQLRKGPEGVRERHHVEGVHPAVPGTMVLALQVDPAHERLARPPVTALLQAVLEQAPAVPREGREGRPMGRPHPGKGPRHHRHVPRGVLLQAERAQGVQGRGAAHPPALLARVGEAPGQHGGTAAVQASELGDHPLRHGVEERPVLDPRLAVGPQEVNAGYRRKGIEPSDCQWCQGFVKRAVSEATRSACSAAAVRPRLGRLPVERPEADLPNIGKDPGSETRHGLNCSMGHGPEEAAVRHPRLREGPEEGAHVPAAAVQGELGNPWHDRLRHAAEKTARMLSRAGEGAQAFHDLAASELGQASCNLGRDAEEEAARPGPRPCKLPELREQVARGERRRRPPH